MSYVIAVPWTFFNEQSGKVFQIQSNSDKLYWIKNESKKKFTEIFKCKKYLKAAWKLIVTLIKRKTEALIMPINLIRSNVDIYNHRSVNNKQFNQYFKAS